VKQRFFGKLMSYSLHFSLDWLDLNMQGAALRAF